MERYESEVIQVSLSYEHSMIKEMEMFGWVLQGRQEIHEEGDAHIEDRVFGGRTLVTKISHYIKLHFARSLSIPNLDKIRYLEAEYYDLPYPNIPQLFPGGWFIWLFFFWSVWPFWYFFGYRPKKALAEQKLPEINRKRDEILSQLEELYRNDLNVSKQKESIEVFETEPEINNIIEGTIIWGEGKYTGQIQNNKPHGTGTHITNSGAKYTGQFIEGIKHGQGAYIDAKGLKYSGGWIKGKPSGKGKTIYASGGAYEGEFEDGKRHGYGTYTSSDGRINKGMWENGDFKG